MSVISTSNASPFLSSNSSSNSVGGSCNFLMKCATIGFVSEIVSVKLEIASILNSLIVPAAPSWGVLYFRSAAGLDPSTAA